MGKDACVQVIPDNMGFGNDLDIKVQLCSACFRFCPGKGCILIVHYLICRVLLLYLSVRMESLNLRFSYVRSICLNPESKVHGANIGLTWVLSAPGGPHVGPISLAIRALLSNRWLPHKGQLCVSMSWRHQATQIITCLSRWNRY